MAELPISRLSTQPQNVTQPKYAIYLAMAELRDSSTIMRHMALAATVLLMEVLTSLLAALAAIRVLRERLALAARGPAEVPSLILAVQPPTPTTRR